MLTIKETLDVVYRLPVTDFRKLHQLNNPLGRCVANQRRNMQYIERIHHHYRGKGLHLPPPFLQLESGPSGSTRWFSCSFLPDSGFVCRLSTDWQLPPEYGDPELPLNMTWWREKDRVIMRLLSCKREMFEEIQEDNRVILSCEHPEHLQLWWTTDHFPSFVWSREPSEDNPNRLLIPKEDNGVTIDSFYQTGVEEDYRRLLLLTASLNTQLQAFQPVA